MKPSPCANRIASLLLALAAAGAAPLVQARPAETTVTWQDAEQAYEIQDFAKALSVYQRLAVHGDARAAALAGQMLWFGQTLYGVSVQRDATMARHWLQQAAADGCVVSAHLLQHPGMLASEKAPEVPYVPGEQGC